MFKMPRCHHEGRSRSVAVIFSSMLHFADGWPVIFLIVCRRLPEGKRKMSPEVRPVSCLRIGMFWPRSVKYELYLIKTARARIFFYYFTTRCQGVSGTM
ncbi:hypothetical protein WJ0W_006322 [Paenibacillus melissococcoides]|uniref:Secreted protein n=1 Tax=Paenibacillus melissococcoides TaxID=2912268 RepID=A0ABN8UDB4_9BACL|nr:MULTISPECIES: hypothetical protein [Paenibacillus]MEB9895875.1 hypothetical protein [Bacillus cereus]CAH8249136.1 hypothetical protein WJ0W_006322 [Paenibacillus melissococcoides]